MGIVQIPAREDKMKQIINGKEYDLGPRAKLEAADLANSNLMEAMLVREWKSFNYEDIHKMDVDEVLEFWNKYKHIVLS